MELEQLELINENLSRIEFLLHTGVLGVQWLAAGLIIAGWLYARRDRDF